MVMYSENAKHSENTLEDIIRLLQGNKLRQLPKLCHVGLWHDIPMTLGFRKTKPKNLKRKEIEQRRVGRVEEEEKGRLHPNGKQLHTASDHQLMQWSEEWLKFGGFKKK